MRRYIVHRQNTVVARVVVVPSRATHVTFERERNFVRYSQQFQKLGHFLCLARNATLAVSRARPLFPCMTEWGKS